MGAGDGSRPSGSGQGGSGAPDAGKLPARRVARRRKRREGSMESLGSTLRTVYPGKERFDEARLFGSWNECVPPRVAKNAQPVRFSKGTLTVHVKTSVWAQELSFLREDLLLRVQAAVPTLKLRDLHFRVGALPEVARIPGLERPPPVPPPKRAVLPQEMSHALDFVEDDSLRAIIREAAAVGLGRLEEHEARVAARAEAQELERRARVLHASSKDPPR